MTTYPDYHGSVVRSVAVSKVPSGRFPFINLPKSIDRAQAIFENDKGGKGIKVPLAFSAWGYSDKSSGGFQTVAALKAYGLLADDGANEDRTVKLTPEARKYFQTEIEDDKAALAAGFAAKPQLLEHLLELWDGATVSDPVARTYLKTEVSLNEQSARSLLGIYKDNLSFLPAKGSAIVQPLQEKPASTGSDSRQEPKDDASVPLTPPLVARVGDHVQWTSGGVDQFAVPRVITEITRDPQHGWFVAIRGEKGKLPMDQIQVVTRPNTMATASESANQADVAANPIEIFMSARGRLQITADVDLEGVDTLMSMLEKYKGILKLTPRH